MKRASLLRTLVFSLTLTLAAVGNFNADVLGEARFFFSGGTIILQPGPHLILNWGFGDCDPKTVKFEIFETDFDSDSDGHEIVLTTGAFFNLAKVLLTNGMDDSVYFTLESPDNILEMQCFVGPELWEFSKDSGLEGIDFEGAIIEQITLRITNSEIIPGNPVSIIDLWLLRF